MIGYIAKMIYLISSWSNILISRQSTANLTQLFLSSSRSNGYSFSESPYNNFPSSIVTMPASLPSLGLLGVKKFKHSVLCHYSIVYFGCSNNLMGLAEGNIDSCTHLTIKSEYVVGVLRRIDCRYDFTVWDKTVSTDFPGDCEQTWEFQSNRAGRDCQSEFVLTDGEWRYWFVGRATLLHDLTDLYNT